MLPSIDEFQDKIQMTWVSEFRVVFFEPWEFPRIHWAGRWNHRIDLGAKFHPIETILRLFYFILFFLKLCLFLLESIQTKSYKEKKEKALFFFLMTPFYAPFTKTALLDPTRDRSRAEEAMWSRAEKLGLFCRACRRLFSSLYW